MIEKHYDIPFVAELAFREKQIQQNYRPVIGIHKWFARRPGTLFRSLLLSEFAGSNLQDCYYEPHDLPGIRVADPFMGGGTPILEANRIGCEVVGIDINPMSYWIVRQAITHLDLESYRQAATDLIERLRLEIGDLYKTTCGSCDSDNADVKYFLWVKTQECGKCGKDYDLFPGYLIAKNKRHPNSVIVCSGCGALNEILDTNNLGSCQACLLPLLLKGSANRNQSRCRNCDEVNVYPRPETGPPTHRMFAIEYNCAYCRPTHKGRFFKQPDQNDLAKYDKARVSRSRLTTPFVPEENIPNGDETARLHRWGYNYYRELFNERQLLGLELSCQLIDKVSDSGVKNALATNLSDLLRYQNMLCRYDTMALKSLDIFSIHGYPVGLVQCESNFLGIPSSRVGSNIGSGGWTNIIEKYTKAKIYCDLPFEVQHIDGRKKKKAIPGEWIGDTRNHDGQNVTRVVELSCEDASQVELPEASLDAVLTDPPYYGNVQYAELIDFCYVWLRRLIGDAEPAFKAATTRNVAELTANLTMERGINHFSEGLSSVFCRMARALKPGSPLVFTYHHNKLDAYYPIVVAILDAGLTCSATFPCPAEMSGSIHISNTISSIVDTVFVCRSTGTTRRSWVVDTPQDIANLVRDDIDQLSVGSLSATRGDTRCIMFGHLARLAVWNLRTSWDTTSEVEVKLSLVSDYIQHKGRPDTIEQLVSNNFPELAARRGEIRDDRLAYSVRDDELRF